MFLEPCEEIMDALMIELVEVESLWFDLHVLVFDVVLWNVEQDEKLWVLRADRQ